MVLLSLAHLHLYNDHSAVRVRLLRLWPTMWPDGVTIDQLRILFLDNEGTEVEGLVDTLELPLFYPFLNEGRIYMVTNFDVRAYVQSFRVCPSTLRICFREDTVVEELPNEHDIPAYSFRFLAAADLPHAVHNHGYMYDLVGEVVGSDPEEALFEEVALLRRKAFRLQLIEGDIVVVVLWDDLIDQFGASMPEDPNEGVVVVLKFVVVKHYKGQEYCVSSNASKFYWNLHYPIAHPLLHNFEVVPVAIDYTLNEALALSTLCSSQDLNVHKTNINNQGSLFMFAGQIKDVNVSWSSLKLKFLVRLIIVNGVDESRILFTTAKFRWIASRIIDATNKEWSNNFRGLLAAVRGNEFKFMVEVGGFNALSNDFDLVLRKLFW